MVSINLNVLSELFGIQSEKYIPIIWKALENIHNLGVGAVIVGNK